MQKTLLFLLMVTVGIGVFGQESHGRGGLKMIKKQPVKYTPEGKTDVQQAIIAGENRGMLDANIGTTWYDMQSYNNLMSRIYSFNDGTVGAVWQCSGQNQNPDRGTGYNYFNGSGWGTPLMHLGSDARTGWPSYAPWGPNGEIIAHYWYPSGQPGPIKFFRRENKGTGDWLESQVFGPEGLSIVWHSIFTSGANNQYVHLLARVYDGAYQGLENALLYYRSSDGGQTWDWEHVIIDGLGSDYFTTSSNLGFSWAKPVGNTIAFCYGFDQFNGMVFKSYDNGESWEQILVYESPIDPFNIPGDTDPFGCGDGCSSIALDANGQAHVVFPKMVHQYIGGELFWIPSTEGIIYWDETKPVLDSTIISSYTNEFLIEAGLLVGYMLPDPFIGGYEILAVQMDYGHSYTSFPQLGIDDQNNLFMVYTSLAPGYTNMENNFRHVLVSASYDNGASWEVPVDINTNIMYIFSECVYPATSVNVADKIHIIFQEDNSPGIYEWLTNHDPVENRMVHMEFDKDYFVKVNETSAITGGVEVSTLYPNPATSGTSFFVRTINQSNVGVIITNTLGQVVQEIGFGIKNPGKNLIDIDVSDLETGLYYCTVKIDYQCFTNKLMVR